MSKLALHVVRRVGWGLFVVVLLVACGSDSTGESDAPGASEALECEQLSYPCALSDVPLEILERSEALSGEALTMLNAGTAMADVAAWLEDQTDVVEVQSDDEAVRFRVDGGRAYWLYGSGVFATLGSPGPAPAGGGQFIPPVLAHVVGPESPSKRAVVISPMLYEFPDIEESGKIAAILSGTRGYEGGVTYKFNAENAPGLVDLSAYRDWDTYDVVHLSTHGKRICDDSGCRATLAAATLDQLIGGEEPAPEKILELDVVGLEIVTGQSGTVYVVLTADFFRNEYGSGLSNTLVFINSCQIFGVQATDIADALKGTSSVFVGWTESVYVVEATAAAIAFFTELSEGGYTAEVARDLIGGLGLGTAPGPHPAPSLIVGGRSDGDGLRIRDVVWVMNPETRVPMEPSDSVLIEGTIGDGEDDLVPYLIQVDGVKPEDANDVTVHIEIDGVAADPEPLSDYEVNGEDQWMIEDMLELGRDVEEGEEVVIHAWVELHEKGESHHEVPAVLTGQREWELKVSYTRTPVDVDGPGSPDSATGTLRLALADFQNPTTPHLVYYSVVGGTMSVDPSFKDRFCIVKADTVTFNVTPGMAGFSELVIDTSNSPMEYRLWINIEGPSFEAEFSCRHGTGEDAPEGYQDPETLKRSVSLLMLATDWDEHRRLTGDGASGSGNWTLVNSSVVGSIRETSYTFSVVR